MTAFNQSVNGTLNFSGKVTKATTRTLPAATLSFVGSTVKGLGRSFTGTLSFTGSLSKRAGKNMTAALTFLGSLTVVAVLLKRFRPASTLFLSGPTSTKFIN